MRLDPEPEPRVEVLGIRHHGPGSARAVVEALDDLDPELILIEGPADADSLVFLAKSSDLVPPVALLAYASDQPAVSAFWPFAMFSPEWQALQWGVRQEIAVQFCDLPASVMLARQASTDDLFDQEGEEVEVDHDEDDNSRTEEISRIRADPLALLAEAAGYDDPERWWDDVVESRREGATAFVAITEAMAAIRAEAPGASPREALREARREAQMRQVLRKSLKAGYRRIAVVCGAWHAPALTGKLPPATADARLLRGLAKRKTTLTWVPWTHSRLSVHSGYGAGVTSPGWYHHLFSTETHPTERWFTAVARVLRSHDLPVSSAHVIEATRLAEALSALRGRVSPGLDEVTEATQSVLCDGDSVRLALVMREVVIGEALGQVPPEAPSVPLEADLRATARRLRLKIDPLEKVLTFDLRKENDREKSRLLNRLRVLDIRWGMRDEEARGTGTFKEVWALSWEPEFAVHLVEASTWGTTVAAATRARLIDRATKAERLAQISAAVESALICELPEVLPEILTALTTRAAMDLDVEHLMEAVPALARAARYGNVRQTDTSALGVVADGLLVRICAALPATVASLSDEAAAVLVPQLRDVHAAVLLQGEQATHRELWLEVIGRIASRDDVHGLIGGRLTRLLVDAEVLSRAEGGLRLRRALSVGADPLAKAAWVEGFLAGGALLLIHDPALLAALDEWVSSLGDEAFVELLPLIRRTLGTFSSPERRSIGNQLRTPGRAALVEPEFDLELARPAIDAVAALLGASR